MGQREEDRAGHSLFAFSAPAAPRSTPQDTDLYSLYPTASLALRLLADFIQGGAVRTWVRDEDMNFLILFAPGLAEWGSC